MDPDGKKTKAALSRPDAPSRGSIPASKKRMRKSTNRKDISKDAESIQASGDLFEHQDGGQDHDSKRRRQDGSVTTVRRRRRSSNTKIPERVAAQNSRSMPGGRVHWPAQEESLPSRFANDAGRLIKAVRRLPTILYPIWKWSVFGYIIWLAISYLAVSIYRSETRALAQMCNIPIVGSRCHSVKWFSNQKIDVSMSRRWPHPKTRSRLL